MKKFLAALAVTATAMLGLAAPAAASPQFARPVSDVSSVGTWTPTPLYAQLDDNDTADVVTSVLSTAEQSFVVGLGAVTDPQTSSGHVIRVNLKKSGSATQNDVLKLQQGTTVIASLNITATTSFATYSYALTGAEADAITDYSALSMWVGKPSSPGNKTSLIVAWTELEVPEFFPAPDVTSFSPDVGAIGDTVTIAGTNLTGATSVTIGGVSASYAVDSDTQITATVPTVTEGSAVAATVTTPGGSDTSPDTMTVAYLAPAPTGSNQTAALQSFIDSVPDNSYLAFAANGTYISEEEVFLTNRHGLTFLGRGATLTRTVLKGPQPPDASHPKTWWYQQFQVDTGSTDITLDDLDFHSAGFDDSVCNYDTNYEREEAIDIRDSQNITLNDVDVYAPGGDGVSLFGTTTDNVTMSGGSIYCAGRSGFTVLGTFVTDTLVDGVTFDDVARSVVDLEIPNVQLCRDNIFNCQTVNFTFQNNVATGVNLNLVAGGGGGIRDGIYVLNNQADTLKGKFGSPSHVTGIPDRFNLVYDGNVDTDPTSGYSNGTVWTFTGVQNLTVTNNVALNAPNGIGCTDCSGTYVESGNDWN